MTKKKEINLPTLPFRGVLDFDANDPLHIDALKAHQKSEAERWATMLKQEKKT